MSYLLLVGALWVFFLLPLGLAKRFQHPSVGFQPQPHSSGAGQWEGAQAHWDDKTPVPFKIRNICRSHDGLTGQEQSGVTLINGLAAGAFQGADGEEKNQTDKEKREKTLPSFTELYRWFCSP